MTGWTDLPPPTPAAECASCGDEPCPQCGGCYCPDLYCPCDGPGVPGELDTLDAP
ncbi:hypothetical protein [Kitasatospora sp. NPDC088783]|uniref:hypothetical protein n=1 Tax=Kitasatospora sp. NPDC088783 TaxID=3364077 RepID=UPI00380980C7